VPKHESTTPWRDWIQNNMNIVVIVGPRRMHNAHNAAYCDRCSCSVVFLSVSLSDCTVRKRLNGSRSYSEWRLIGTESTLLQTRVPIPLRLREGSGEILPIVRCRNIASIRCGLRVQLTMSSCYQVIRAMGNSYHAECFRCNECCQPLHQQPFTVDVHSRPHCVTDYVRYTHAAFNVFVSSAGYSLAELITHTLVESRLCAQTYEYWPAVIKGKA